MSTTQHAPSATAIVATSLALLFLWGGSWALSSVELGRWSLVIALVIAVAKAALVTLVFMELFHARPSVKLIAVTAVAMVALLLSLTFIDVVARGAG
jgi:cytochrome c oxidase subunit 4